MSKYATEYPHNLSFVQLCEVFFWRIKQLEEKNEKGKLNKFETSIFSSTMEFASELKELYHTFNCELEEAKKMLRWENDELDELDAFILKTVTETRNEPYPKPRDDKKVYDCGSTYLNIIVRIIGMRLTELLGSDTFHHPIFVNAETLLDDDDGSSDAEEPWIEQICDDNDYYVKVQFDDDDEPQLVTSNFVDGVATALANFADDFDTLAKPFNDIWDAASSAFRARKQPAIVYYAEDFDDGVEVYRTTVGGIIVYTVIGNTLAHFTGYDTEICGDLQQVLPHESLKLSNGATLKRVKPSDDFLLKIRSSLISNTVKQVKVPIDGKNYIIFVTNTVMGAKLFTKGNDTKVPGFDIGSFRIEDANGKIFYELVPSEKMEPLAKKIGAIVKDTKLKATRCTIAPKPAAEKKKEQREAAKKAKAETADNKYDAPVIKKSGQGRSRAAIKHAKARAKKAARVASA